MNENNTADQSGADERAKFEATLKDKRGFDAYHFERNDDGTYSREHVEGYWHIWKLASTQPAPQAAQSNWKDLLAVILDMWDDGERPYEAQTYVPGSLVTQMEEVRALLDMDVATPQPFPAPAVHNDWQKQQEPKCATGEQACDDCVVSGECLMSPAVQSGDLASIAKKAGFHVHTRDFNNGAGALTMIMTSDDGRDCINITEKLTEFYRQAIAQTAPAVAGEAWLPIETAPKDGTKIDIYTSKGERIANVRWVVEDRKGREKDKCIVDGWKYAGMDPTSSFYGGNFTHWMPMPAAPSQGAKQ